LPATLLLALALGIGGCATQNAQPTVADAIPSATQVDDEAVLAEAEKDLESRQYKLAYDRLLKLKAGVMASPRAQYIAAESLLGMGFAKDALNVYRPLEADGGYKARALQGEGIALLTLGSMAEAQPKLEAAVAADAKLWRAWNALGHVYDQQQRWTDSEKAYREATAGNPGSADIINNHGMSLMLQGRYAEAEAAFEQALAIDPGLLPATSNLRLSLAWQGRYSEALEGLAPGTSGEALNNVGYVAMLRGDYEAAERYLSQAMEVSATYNEAAARNLELLKSTRDGRQAMPQQNGAASLPVSSAPLTTP
jgi:Flp pilus assembly protein TadD